MTDNSKVGNGLVGKGVNIDAYTKSLQPSLAAEIAATDNGSKLLGFLGGVFRHGEHDGKVSSGQLTKYVETYLRGSKLEKEEIDIIKKNVGKGVSYEEAARIVAEELIGREMYSKDANADRHLTLKESSVPSTPAANHGNSRESQNPVNLGNNGSGRVR